MTRRNGWFAIVAAALAAVAAQPVAVADPLALPPPPWSAPPSALPDSTQFDSTQWTPREFAQAAQAIAEADSYFASAGLATSPGTLVDLQQPAADCSPWADECDRGYGNWCDNSLLFFAGDGWRTRADDDYPGNFGLRAGFNSGIGWWDSPIRLQLGGSYAGYDLDGRDGDLGADPFSNASVEEQLIVTAGVYKRSNICRDDRWAWGGVIDFLYDDDFGESGEEIFSRQGRASLSYAWNEANEFGTWVAFRLNWSRYVSDTRGPIKIRPLTQTNFFWHANWDFGGDTWLYAGFAEEPGDWLLGFTGQAPLSESVALVGGFTYVIPSAPAGDPVADPFPGAGQNYAEAYWNVTFGIVWYPGWKAANRSVSGDRGLPLLPVADNGSFLIRAPTGDL